MTDHPDASAQAMVDQIRAYVRDRFPEKSQAWRDVWTVRAIHARTHDGDMTGAPEFPNEGGVDD